MTYQPILQIPAEIELLNLPSSINWIDDGGILCSISKNKVERSPSKVKENLDSIKRLLGSKKVYVLKDITNMALGGRHMHDFVVKELPSSNVKALALVSGSPMGTMIAKLFMILEKHPYQVQIFSSEASARVWLQTKIKTSVS